MVLNNWHQLRESWQFASCEAEIFEDAYAEAWLIGCQVHFGRHFPQVFAGEVSIVAIQGIAAEATGWCEHTSGARLPGTFWVRQKVPWIE